MKLNFTKPLPVDWAPLRTLWEQDQLYEVIAVALDLNVFEALTTWTGVQEFAGKQGYNPLTVYYLFEVLVQVGLIEQQGGKYRNTMVSSTYLREKSILYLGTHFIANKLFGDVAKPLVQCLTQEPGSDISPEPEWNPERLRQIGVSGLLGSIQATVEAVTLDRARHFLDLGGGHGFYSIALAQKYPHMHITLLDLPQVIPLAQMYVSDFDQEARIRCVGANFLQEDIGEGYDAVLCANVLHSDKRDIVLPKVFRGLNRGGQIIVKCRIEDGESTLRAALAKLLWHIRGGKEFYSARQWEEMIANHGFEQLRTVNVEGIFATIIGMKP